MWGNYADYHKGVCFIYETTDCDGKDCILIGSKKLEVKPIEYMDEVVERNFFNTFGRLTYAQILTWLTGRNGLVSEMISSFSEANENDWRNKYWEDYIKKYFRKNSAWEHEQEFRMLLHDILHEYDDKSARNLSYDASALKGIIFGINTSVDDKIQIVKKLCQRNSNFKHVELFQAKFDEETSKIIIRKKHGCF